jgi:hypothetical protein
MKFIVCLIVFFSATLWAEFVDAKYFTNAPKIAVTKEFYQDRPFLHTNEKLKFEVTWLGILGGYATFETSHFTNENGPQHQFILKAWTTPFVSTVYKLVSELTSRVSAFDLNTFWFREDKIERTKWYYHTMTFAKDGMSYDYAFLRNSQPPTNVDRIAASGFGHDVVSSFFVTRTLDLSKPGTVYTMPVYFTRDKFTIEVWVIGKREIRTKWGKMNTVLIVPKMKFHGVFLNTGDIFIYLSDDEYHTPVLMESEIAVGSFMSTLTEGYPKPKQ